MERQPTFTLTDGRVVTINANEVSIYDPATGKTVVCFCKEGHKFYGERVGSLQAEVPNVVCK